MILAIYSITTSPLKGIIILCQKNETDVAVCNIFNSNSLQFITEGKLTEDLIVVYACLLLSRAAISFCT